MGTEQNDGQTRRWGPCESCGFETWIKEYKAGPPNERIVEHCIICANTLLGYVSMYPSHYHGLEVVILRSMGYITNMILAEQHKQFEIIVGVLFALVDPAGPLPMTHSSEAVKGLHSAFLAYMIKCQKPSTAKTLGE